MTSPVMPADQDPSRQAYLQRTALEQATAELHEAHRLLEQLRADSREVAELEGRLEARLHLLDRLDAVPGQLDQLDVVSRHADELHDRLLRHLDALEQLEQITDSLPAVRTLINFLSRLEITLR